MALTVTPNMTDISLCEDTTNWSTGVTNDLYMLEGLYCLGLKVSETESALITYTFGSSQDMSNGEHVYFWVQIQGIPDTKANGGIRLYAEDSSGNYGYFNVGGSENYPGGWVCYCFKPGASYSSGSGSVITSSIAKVGVRFKALSKALGNNPNCFWDAVRYGTGLTLKSGSTDAIDFDDIVTAENNDKYWGIIEKVNGVFFVQGKLVFGDTSTSGVDFIDKSEAVVFKDLPFGDSNFSELQVFGNTTGTTNFVLGESSGGRGVSGCVLKAAGAVKFKFTATDANIDKLQIYGTSFIDSGDIALPVTAANREIISCNFEACSGIVASTCKMQYCNIVYADDRGVTISSTSHNITDCNFITCGHCMNITESGTYTFDNLKFSGSDGSSYYDIEYSDGGTGALTINCTNGSNPNGSYVEKTGGTTGTVTINNAVNLNVYVKDEDNNALSGVSVAIYKTSDDSQLMNELTAVTTGLATETFNYASDTPIYIRVRKSSTGTTRYYPVKTTGEIKTTGFTLTVVLKQDNIVAS